MVLARAKDLVLGDLARPTPLSTEARLLPEPVADDTWDMEKQNKSFWASMMAADRRLADLRRAIDAASAEMTAREAAAKASSEIDCIPLPGESRCETAARVITDALGMEKS